MSEPFSNVNVKNYKGNSVVAFVIQNIHTNFFITTEYHFESETYKVSPFIIIARMFESFEKAVIFKDENLSYGDFKISMITIELGEEF